MVSIRERKREREGGGREENFVDNYSNEFSSLFIFTQASGNRACFSNNNAKDNGREDWILIDVIVQCVSFPFTTNVPAIKMALLRRTETDPHWTENEGELEIVAKNGDAGRNFSRRGRTIGGDQNWQDDHLFSRPFR